MPLIWLLITLCIVYISSDNVYGENYKNIDTTYMTKAKNIKSEKYIDTIKIKKDSLTNMLITEIDNYIRKQSPNANEKLSNIIAENGLNNNIDICFLMAQTQNETNFGTSGIGKENSKKSIFGIRSRKYDNYEKAIKDYCFIIKTKYLGENRSEKDLMNNFTSLSGLRYAEASSYEYYLKITYKAIKRKTKINEIQMEIRSMS